MSPSLCLALLLLASQTPDAADPETASPEVATGEAPAPLYTPPAVRPFEMPAGAGEPGAYASDVAAPAAAVKLDAYARSYEGPKTPTEQVYERGVRGAFESAQVRMGRLDGQWSVAAADGAPLLALLLHDPGVGEIDGAWRDVTAGPGVSRSGLVLSVSREGATLVIRYAPLSGGQPCELRLHPGADGRFTGTLRTAQGHRPVVMSRS